MTRVAEVSRKTNETTIDVELNIDGQGNYDIETGSTMLNHLVDQLARHGALNLVVKAIAHQDPDGHHITEDLGIVLGRAFDQALGDRIGLTRMANAIIPMDDALALVAIDLAGRSHATVELPFNSPQLGDLRTELISHFLETFANEARLSIHVKILAGGNDHHVAEGTFKALARALRAAMEIDPRLEGQMPSTKGTLS